MSKTKKGEEFNEILGLNERIYDTNKEEEKAIKRKIDYIFSTIISRPLSFKTFMLMLI